MSSSPAAIHATDSTLPQPTAWWKLVVWVVVCAGLPAGLLRLGHPDPVNQVRTVKLTKDVAPDQLARIVTDVNSERIDVPRTIASLKAANPDYIAIGNSMVFSRLGMDPADMSKLTGKKFFFILHGSSASAAWFLMLKNIVAASGVKPKLVFFFFRDTEATSPLFRTGGTYSIYINSLRGKEEPVLDGILNGAEVKQDIIARTSRFLAGEHGLYSFPEWTESSTRRLTDLAMDFGSPKVTKIAQHDYLANRFSLDHLRHDVPVDLPPPGAGMHDGGTPTALNDPSNYVGGQDRSFLPAIVDVAQANHFKLMFFRVKMRPQQDNTTPQTPEMRAFIQRLQRWMEQRDILFYDETDDPDLPLDIYADGDHVSAEKRPWYMGYFWKRVSKLFPP